MISGESDGNQYSNYETIISGKDSKTKRRDTDESLGQSQHRNRNRQFKK